MNIAAYLSKTVAAFGGLKFISYLWCYRRPKKISIVREDIIWQYIDARVSCQLSIPLIWGLPFEDRVNPAFVPGFLVLQAWLAKYFEYSCYGARHD